MLDPTLVLLFIECSWDEVVEDGLGLVDHILVKLLFLINVKEIHVRYLLNPIKVEWTLFEEVAFGQEQLQYYKEADDRISVKFKAFVVISSIRVGGSQRFHDQIDVIQELVRGRLYDKVFVWPSYWIDLRLVLVL